MIIEYDKDIKIAGIGQSPWQRFGPQCWFNNYAIVSQDRSTITKGQLGSAKLFILPKKLRENGKSTAALKNIVKTEWFKKLASTDLLGYSYLAYRPIVSELPIKLITNNFSISEKYENKASFRVLFDKLVTFPEYEIAESNELNSLLTYKKYNEKWGEIVLQDEELSGGVGTYIVKNYNDYKDAIKNLSIRHKKIIISDRISNGTDYSVQCCVTKYGIFVSPLQKQIISSPVLSNTELSGGEKFNGVQIGELGVSADIENQARSSARVIGDYMKKDGFKGIFSVDFFIDKDNEQVYTLETNPRMTGVTPLYNLIQAGSDTPLPLLHILEVGDYDYSIPSFAKNMLDVDIPKVSMLILRSKKTTDYVAKNFVKSGTYSISGEYISDNLRMENADILLESYVSEGDKISPGDKIASLFVRGSDIGKGVAEVTKEYQPIINKLYGMI